MKNLILILGICFLNFALAQENGEGIKYIKSKKIDFESLLIEGENKRPELSVVTGNLGEKDLGLLKLRENFQDMMTDDAGEEIQ